jgi:hypothetical protein
MTHSVGEMFSEKLIIATAFYFLILRASTIGPLPATAFHFVLRHDGHQDICSSEETANTIKCGLIHNNSLGVQTKVTGHCVLLLNRSLYSSLIGENRNVKFCIGRI